MAKVLKGEDETYRFYCPGCGHDHVYFTGIDSPKNQKWSFNGNVDNPTFTPSLLNRWGKEAVPTFEEPDLPAPENGWSGRCHLFVKDGKIIYCGDSTHHLKGQTVQMIEK